MTLTAQQLELRRGRIGASSIAAILGLDLSKGPHDAYKSILDLDGDEPANDTVDAAVVAPTDVGNILEGPIARDMYARRRGLQLVSGVTLLHPEKDWMLATPDFGVAKPGVANPTKLRCTSARMWAERVERNVEVKVVGRYRTSDWSDEPDGVPDYYLVQVVWQMLVTGVRVTDVVALIGGTDFRVYTIEFNERLATAIESRVERWYREHIVERIPPAPDGSAAAGALLRAVWPRNNGNARTPDLLAEVAARELHEARARFDEAKQGRDLAEQRMQQLIAESDGFTSRNWSCSWKYQPATEVKAFTRKGGRVLRFNWKGD